MNATDLRAGVILVALFLSGCETLTAPGRDEGGPSSVSTCVGKNDEAQKKFQAATLPQSNDAADFTDRALDRIDLFLDCFIGPAPTPQTKLLRGHVIVGLAARYAAFNATGEVPGVGKVPFEPYDELEDDIGATLTSIEKAEILLRQKSGIAGVTPSAALLDGRPGFLGASPEVYEPVNEEYDKAFHIKRILGVVRVYRNAGMPTYRRARVTALRAISVSAGSLSELRSILRVVATGISKYLVIDKFGGAYRKAAFKHLQQLNGRDPTRADWKKWDDAIVEACARLARFAETPHHCIPG